MKRCIHALAILALALSLLAPSAWADTRTTGFAQTLNTSTRTSDVFDPFDGSSQAPGFSVAVTGTFVASWRLQLSFDAGVTWIDYFVFNTNDAIAISNLAPALWRVTAAGAGDYTSGSASARFVKGGATSSVSRVLSGERTTISAASPMTVGGIAAMVGGTLTKSTKTTAYASGQLFTQGVAGASVAMAMPVARAIDTTGMVRRFRLKSTDATFLGATVRAHLLKDSPTFTNGDGANFAGGISESNYICSADIVLDLSFAGGIVKGSGVPSIGNECNFEPSSGTRNIFAVLEARSTTAGGHTASSTFTLVLETLQN
ncbi:MAG TPA: hypothetical protein VK634_06895 [Reyranella sp.]|nr:hypothetical protein [Reyranella sp.]HTE80402.1 hypothetical protein [Reyranella sp.]